MTVREGREVCVSLLSAIWNEMGGYGGPDLVHQRCYFLPVFRRSCVSSGSQPVFLPRAGTSRLLAILRPDVCRAGSYNFDGRARLLCGEMRCRLGEQAFANASISGSFTLSPSLQDITCQREGRMRRKSRVLRL